MEGQIVLASDDCDASDSSGAAGSSGKDRSNKGNFGSKGDPCSCGEATLVVHMVPLLYVQVHLNANPGLKCQGSLILKMY